MARNYSRAHDCAEDLLTSTVFGLLRYLPQSQGLLAVLRRARFLTLMDGALSRREAPRWLTVEADACEVELLPWRDAYGEPDGLLTLTRDDMIVGRVLLEAKLHSGKSQREEGGEEDAALGDQLCKLAEILVQPLLQEGQPG